MLPALKKINQLFLLLSGILILFCGFELYVLEKIYPYTFLGIMGILSFSSFLSLSFLINKFDPKFHSYLLGLAVLNTILLYTFSFFPSLLRYLWNISFGINFLFIILFVIGWVYQRTSKLEKFVFYITLITGFFFEITLGFKLTQGWIYNVLTSLFLLETVLLLTLGIFRLRKVS
jgi:hypothetical protein